MPEPQSPKDKRGNGTEEKSGKKRHNKEPKVPTTGAEEPVSAIIDAYAEQDEQEGREIEDLASGIDEDEPEEDDYDEDDDDADGEEYPEGDEDEDSEDEGDILDQEGHVEDNDEQSSETGNDASQETEEELIARHVAAINACQSRTDEDRFRVTGEIVRDFYEGDFKAASDKNPWRSNTLKKLRDNAQLEVKPRRLGDWIQAYGCWAGIHARDPKVAPGFSAALELIPIEDEVKRFELAVEIHEKKLSVRQARKRVLEITSKKVDPRLVDKLLSKIKDPRSIPVSTDYQKMDEEFLENDLTKKERLRLRAEIETKREQLHTCNDFLDLLEKRLSDIDL